MDEGRYTYLKRKFYEGEISENEEQELLVFFKNDETLMSDFKEFGKTFIGIRNKESEYLIANLLKRISQSRVKKIGFKEIMLVTLRYAAIIVLSIFIWQAVNQMIDKSSSKYSKGYFETIVPKGEKSQLVMPDGTIVWLNSESSIRYSGDFNREVTLEGEAYIKVARDKKVPFKVITKGYIVEATGTEFNVMAYNDCQQIETSLIEGVVNINANISGENKRVCTLKPGEKVAYNLNQNKYYITSSMKEQDVAWKDNQFVFEDISFEELVKRLERWYDVSIVFADPGLSKIKYRGKFKNKETIWQVLDIIKLTTPIEYELNDRKLKIRKI